jgi:predicted lysophospholipase L1 biosynthesis ABC-type transport system permease subunit
VRRYWPGGNPIGRQITFGVGTDRAVFHVVGLVPDIPPMSPSEPVEPQMYWSNRQLPRPFSYFIVRSVGKPDALVAPIRSAIRGIDADLAVRNPVTMRELVTRALTRPQFNMVLLVAFGLTALALAAIGTHGLLAYQVSQRTREVGIRIALGAARGQIVGEVLRRGLMLAGFGIVIGFVGAMALGRTIASLTAGVSPRDPLTLVASAVVLALVAAAASLFPALKASRIDPIVTLSAE